MGFPMELRQSPSWLVGTELGMVKAGFPNKKLSWVQADTSQALPSAPSVAHKVSPTLLAAK